MEVLTYVPANVSLILSGYMIQGWNSITVTRNSPVFQQIQGIRGKNTRTRFQDTSATITIETYQTEQLNEVLSYILQADATNGTARLEISLSESTGTSFFTTSTAYITAYPELGYTAEAGSVRWTLACEDSQMMLGTARNSAVGAIQNGVARLKDFATNLINQF